MRLGSRLWDRLTVEWNRRRVVHKARQEVGPACRVRLVTRRDASDAHHLGFARDRSTLALSLHASKLVGEVWPTMCRVSGLAVILSRCKPGAQGVADFSDGEAAGPGLVSLCSNFADSVLVPDVDFVLSGGYAAERAVGAQARPFAERRDLVLWRGSTTGPGRISADDMTPDAPGLSLRARMCLLLRDVPGCDAKFATALPWTEGDLGKAREAGILGEHIANDAWAYLRYHVAVDGNTLAWSSTFTRLLMGCCILKPDSSGGYRQWYSDRFLPWQHYVPVAADLGDLRDKIEWCRGHESEAAAIAARGQQLAMSMSFAGEVATAARRIDETLDARRSVMAADLAGIIPVRRWLLRGALR